LHAAVRDVFDVVAGRQRCQWHKRENVLEYLPESPLRDISAEAASGL
jgi:hypothetical protein